MRKTILIASLALAAGIAIGYFALPRSIEENAASETANSGEKEVLYWVAPMDANFRRDKPGKSPMGMDLVPVYAEDANDNQENVLRISAATTNTIGVRTATATISDLYRNIETIGYVGSDETKTAHIHVRTAGWIDRLYQKATGEQVTKAEVMFELYSPDLVAAQSEYLQALRLNNQALTEAGTRRLRTLGMSAEEIAELKASKEIKERIHITAPQDGVIESLSVGEGMYVTPGTTVYSLVDLSTLWLKAEVFEAQAAWVSAGQRAELALPAFPGETWSASVDYIYPEVDPKSRTVAVRLKIENKDGRLKPNMFGNVSLMGSPVTGALSIPTEALIRTGQNNRVILALGDGKFRPAEVSTGLETGGRIQILAGLSEGETVVTSGQFLIDSEASTNAALLRMLDTDETMGDTKMAETSEEMDAEEEIHHGMGTVVAVNGDGTVTLQHDPIESLGWPEMTMDFSVSSNVDLSEFAEGDRMHFMLVKSPEGPFIITTAMKM
jgi:Cu(I)/Ag(I) efflux system membrane fusion protein